MRVARAGLVFLARCVVGGERLLLGVGDGIRETLLLNLGEGSDGFLLSLGGRGGVPAKSCVGL